MHGFTGNLGFGVGAHSLVDRAVEIDAEVSATSILPPLLHLEKESDNYLQARTGANSQCQGVRQSEMKEPALPGGGLRPCPVLMETPYREQPERGLLYRPDLSLTHQCGLTQ